MIFLEAKDNWILPKYKTPDEKKIMKKVWTKHLVPTVGFTMRLLDEAALFVVSVAALLDAVTVLVTAASDIEGSVTVFPLTVGLSFAVPETAASHADIP